MVGVFKVLVVFDQMSIFQFQIFCIGSVLGEKAECPRAEQLLNEVAAKFTKNYITALIVFFHAAPIIVTN